MYNWFSPFPGFLLFFFCMFRIGRPPTESAEKNPLILGKGTTQQIPPDIVWHSCQGRYRFVSFKTHPCKFKLSSPKVIIPPIYEGVHKGKTFEQTNIQMSFFLYTFQFLYFFVDLHKYVYIYREGFICRFGKFLPKKRGHRFL